MQFTLWGGAILLFVLMWIRGGVSLRDLLGGGSGTGSSVTVGERGVNAGGDVRSPVVTGEHNRVKVIHGDRITVGADKELYRRLLGSEGEAPPAEPPPAPLIFAGRDRELSEVKARLIGGGESGEPARETMLVLTGIPGVGKTALATVAAVDDAVRKAFPGGTLWVSLGPSPDVVGELDGLARRLAHRLRRSPGHPLALYRQCRSRRNPPPHSLVTEVLIHSLNKYNT